MQNSTKTLLPKAVSYWEALIRSSQNILPRFILSTSLGFRRHKITFKKVAPTALLIFYLLGYQPAFSFLPLKPAEVKAQDQQFQEVTTEAVPDFQVPLDGYISTRFSWYHPGLDIATSFGTPIRPVSDGVILEVNFGRFGYGNHVIVTHGGGYLSLYGHMNEIYVQKDQEVTGADAIGSVGLTGFTSGPHVHLEVHKDGKNINPEELLPKITNIPSEQFLKPYGGNGISQTTIPVAATPKPEPTEVKLAKTLKLDL